MKRIIALCGVILLVVLYVLTLIFSIMDSSLNMDFFRASVAATVFIPIFLWAAIRFYEYQHRDDK